MSGTCLLGNDSPSLMHECIWRLGSSSFDVGSWRLLHHSLNLGASYAITLASSCCLHGLYFHPLSGLFGADAALPPFPQRPQDHRNTWRGRVPPGITLGGTPPCAILAIAKDVMNFLRPPLARHQRPAGNRSVFPAVPPPPPPLCTAPPLVRLSSKHAFIELCNRQGTVRA